MSVFQDMRRKCIVKCSLTDLHFFSLHLSSNVSDGLFKFIQNEKSYFISLCFFLRYQLVKRGRDFD